MDKTKIDWCDSTWNPVTGCLHGCEYCYARGIAKQFGLDYAPKPGDPGMEGASKYDSEEGLDTMLELEKPYRKHGIGKVEPYPMSFYPTFHRYRLNDYIGKKGRNIFVCSMADLFGNWVPDEWIEEVFKACDKAPQHNYLFLTKNPQRYVELAEKGILRCSNNMWYGWSQTRSEEVKTLCFPCNLNLFISVEPILEQIHPSLEDWIIVGAETGRRKNKIVPKREWIEQIVEDCREFDIPLFMKSSLAEIWGEPLIQEFPKKFQKVEKINV